MNQNRLLSSYWTKEVIKASGTKMQDVSIVAIFHCEGIYAHWMLTEFENARQHAHENNIKVQLVCVLDNPDEDTKNIVTNHKAIQDQDIIVCVSTGDLGTNRNIGIELAQGEFIGIANADNYMGQLWITNAYSLAKKYGASVAIHPEYEFLFGEKHILAQGVDQRFFDIPLAGLVCNNFWGGQVFAHSAIFKSTPYQSTRSEITGYGFTDWHWSLEIISKGVVHISAEGTALYKRKKKTSLLKREADCNAIVRNSHFFQNPELWDVGFDLSPELFGLSHKVVPHSSGIDIKRRKIRFAGRYNRLAIFKKFLKIFRPLDTFPSWMIEDLKFIATLEANLFPSEKFLKRFRSPELPIISWKAGNTLKKIWLDLSKKKFDVVVLAPWIKTGGSDKGVLQYLDYYQEKFKSVLLLTTRVETSNRLDRIPQGVTYCEIGQDLQVLSRDEQCLILARLLLLLQPKLIQNINSEVGWLTYQRHGKALHAESMVLIASLFAEGINAIGQRWGLDVDYLPHCRETLDALVVDSIANAHKYSEDYVVSPKKIYPIHFYVADRSAVRSPPKTKTIVEGDTQKRYILWAGRICRSKRPDLLLEIVKLFPDVLFDVFGPIESESRDFAKKLQGEKNVKMHGEYSNPHVIMRSKPYAAMLYTTASDGMPNVILEAAIEKLPIIAPPYIGGIRDIINEDTGYCVGGDDVKSYAQALRQALDTPELAQQKAERAFDLLATDFSRAKFNAGMTKVMIDFNLDRHFS